MAGREAEQGTPIRANRDGSLSAIERDARSVAERLPELVIEAKRVAQTVAHGIHGRRRAGPGETFWQFRHLLPTDPVQLIDWRRSASSDHFYVREREWEAAHTLWLWPDLSPSMTFKSHLGQHSKRDRALVLLLASADLLVRSGERVALLGLTRPTASRNAMSSLAAAIALSADSNILTSGHPPTAPPSRYSSAILFGDFLDPLDDMLPRLQQVASKGIAGHLIQILDPAEETLPYQGRAEFLGMEGEERWIGDRVESLRGAYQDEIRRHRAELAEFAKRLGWSMLLHHTDRPASEVLLQLIVHLEGKATGYRGQRSTALEAEPAGESA